MLAIDASRANKSQKTGVEWTSYFIIQELKKLVPKDVRVVLYSDEPLAGQLAELPDNWTSRVLRWPPRRLWTALRLSWEMVAYKPDTLFVIGHVPPYFAPAKTVFVIHDIGHRRFQAAYRPLDRFLYERAIRRAKRRGFTVVTPSAFTKQELVAVYGFAPQKITVVPLAYDQERFNAASPELPAALGIREPYFLYVGRIESKKNIVTLVRAFAAFKKETGALHALVLAGVPGVGYGEIAATVGTSLSAADIFELGYVATEHLPALYAHATAFVFPSWYEGFGIPILEAMAMGTPVIAAKAGSIPEVAGASALLVDPGDTTRWVQVMIKVQDSIVHEDLRVRGFERIKNFSWEEAARRILAVSL